MYCNECGAQVKDDAKFCAKCGAGQIAAPEKLSPAQNPYEGPPPSQTTITLEPVAPAKKPAIAKIVSIVAAAVVILGVGAAGFLFIPKLFAGSKPKADNCLAVMLDAIENAGSLSSFEYKITASQGDEGKFALSGFLALGKDLQNSILEIKADIEDDSSRMDGRAVFHNGFFGVYSRSVSEYWGDEELYEYVNIQDILGNFYDMLSQMGVDIEELGVDANNFIKNGRINYGEFERIGKKISENSSDYLDGFGGLEDFGDFGIEGDLDISEYLGKLPAIGEELNKMFEKFLYVECEKEAVLGEFVSGPEISKENGSTTYKYSVNPIKLIKALMKYIIESVPKYPEISALLEDLAGAQKMTLDEFLNFASYSLRNALEEISDEENEIKFTVTVSKNRILEKLAVSFDMKTYDWEYDVSSGEYGLVDGVASFSFTIALSGHDSVKPDAGEIESFMKKAEKNADNRGDGYGDYDLQ
ncbi:MAG: zinc ribbon domain-containing protein [Oscillospiraceae bacterium]|nr:zinc ribbon domain-containing protein [Oscillospiraceae bacterium]